MSVYKLTTPYNSEDSPLKLGRGATFNDITEVDYRECFVDSPKFTNQTSISNINCGKLVNKDYNQFFSGCSNLEVCDLSNTDLSNISSMNDTFAGCVKLSDIRFGQLPATVSCEVNLADCPLTENTLNNLTNLGEGQCTFVFGKETRELPNYQECVSILVEKGYTIAVPTITISGNSEINVSGDTSYNAVVTPKNIGVELEWTITPKE